MGSERAQRAGGLIRRHPSRPAWCLLALVALLAWSGAAHAKPSAPAPLPGKTYDFEYDGLDIKHPERAWLGRAYVPPRTAKATKPVPLVVFLHGLNKALIKYRYEPDPDGDRPIRWALCDWTRQEPHRFAFLPKEGHLRRLALAQMNVALAAEDLRSVVDLIRLEHEEGSNPLRPA